MRMIAIVSLACYTSYQVTAVSWLCFRLWLCKGPTLSRLTGFLRMWFAGKILLSSVKPSQCTLMICCSQSSTWCLRMAIERWNLTGLQQPKWHQRSSKLLACQFQMQHISLHHAAPITVFACIFSWTMGSVTEKQVQYKYRRSQLFVSYLRIEYSIKVVKQWSFTAQNRLDWKETPKIVLIGRRHISYKLTCST